MLRAFLAFACLLALLAPAAEAADPLDWPDRRFAPCAALDGARGDFYVFGGRAEGAGTHHADAWRIGVRRPAPRWSRVAAAGAPGAPAPVRSCAAAFDRDGRQMLVFGGWDGVTPTNGVWALKRDGEWRRLCDAASCGPGPTPRRAAQAVYDPAGRRLLVFGGLDGQYRNDLWALSLGERPRWQPLAAAGPQPGPRAGHSLAYDAERRRLWLFGGTTTGADFGDTWTFDLAAGTWSEVPATGPAPRSGAVLVRDTRADRLVLHGGWESGPNRYPRDAWMLEDLGGTPRWEQAQPDSEAPQPRYFGVGAFDPPTRRMLVFGGGIGASAFKDIAALRLGGRTAWEPFAPRTPPTPRDQVAIGLDAEARGLVAFGGFGSGTFPGRPDAGTHLADAWRLRLDGGWRAATPRTGEPMPLHREAAAVASDPRTGRMFVIGGLEGDSELADAWVADTGGRGRLEWRALCSPSSCGSGPEPRWGGHAVYDPAGDRVIVFGGRRTDGTSFNDVWELALAGAPRWERLDVAGEPPAPRWGGAVGFDAEARRMVVAGGQTGADASAVSHDDAWSLTLDGRPAWHRLTPAGAPPAPRRSAAYAVRDTGESVALLVAGGLRAGSGAHYNDVWSLDLGTPEGAWRELAPPDCANPALPACRRSAGAVHDPRRDRLVMVFGRDAERFYGDAWAFDLATGRWQRLE